jgi:flagellar motor switch protein FliN
MSDGSLTQDEIDALLQGPESPAGDDEVQAGGAGSLSPQELEAFAGLVRQFVGSQASNLSMLMGKTVTIGQPTVQAAEREAYLQNLAEEMVEVKIDYNEGLVGEHLYVMTPEAASRIAGLMMGQEDVDLNDAAMSALQEAVSQITGPAVTTIGDTIQRTIMTQPPESQSVPKAMLQLPRGAFVRITYPMAIEGDGEAELTEIIGEDTVREIVEAANPTAGGAAQQAPGAGMGGVPGGAAQQPQQANPFAGMQQPQQQQQQGMFGGQAASGMQGFGQQQMPQQPMQGQMYAQGPPPNVQSVQFPNLQPQVGQSEQGNIGLLMDVFMEMTVELGRTRKQIREILGFGEGTILELDKLAGEPVDILVNHKLIAKGEVVVIDENFGVRITEIVSPMERMTDLA